jgi:hypothetical protein
MKFNELYESMKYKKFYAFNHNGSILGSYDSEKEANKDVEEYEDQTGNWGDVVAFKDLDKNQRQEVDYELKRSQKNSKPTKSKKVKYKKFYAFNHNGSILGDYNSKKEADADVKNYKYQTGNMAKVVPFNKLSPDQKEEIDNWS